MAFREVPMFEVREVLRLWLGGEGLRAVARLSRVDRKTVRRYVDAAVEVGVTAEGGVAQLTDEVLGRVVEIVRPHRTDGHGHAWAALVARRETVEGWVTAGVAGVKICELLARDGVMVPERTVQRFIAAEFGPRRGQGSTVRIADGEPGHELQVDFARLGLLDDPDTGRRRVCHALIFTAVFSKTTILELNLPAPNASVPDLPEGLQLEVIVRADRIEVVPGIAPDAVRWVPSNGGAPALQDLASGGISVFTGSPIEAKAMLDAGRVRTILLMTEERHPNFPDVPSAKEAGLDWTYQNWFALAAPKGIPADRRKILFEAAERTMQRPEVRKAMADRGITPVWDKPGEFAAYAKTFTGYAVADPVLNYANGASGRAHGVELLVKKDPAPGRLSGFSGFASNGPWPGFAAHWRAFAQAQGAVCGYIAQHPAFGHPSLEEAVAGEAPLYFLDLQGGMTGVLAHAGTDRRRDWRRWQEQGHRFVTDRAALTDFLQREHRPFLDRMGAGAAAYWNEAALAALLQAPGAGLLGTAEPDGRLVAVTLYGWTPWGAEGMIQAALPEGRAHTAALMLGGIDDLAGRGVPWLNLGGGVRPGDSVAAAKLRWRPRTQAFRRLKQVYDPDRYAALCAAAGVPATVTEGYFPAYGAGPAAAPVASQPVSQLSNPAGSIR